MNLEAMFFPKANINYLFDEIVTATAGLINSYTVESSFDEDRIKESLVKHKGRVRADLHSAGNIFVFDFYGSSFPQEFKFEFNGEGQLFKVVYEIDSSNPNGHLTLFANDSTSILIKQMKLMLKEVSEKAKEQASIENAFDTADSEVLEKTSSQAESTTLPSTEAAEITRDPAVKINREHCKCPDKQLDINTDTQFLIEHFSDKVTRHFHFSGDEQLTIYQCKYCQSFIMIEARPERTGKVDSKAFSLDSKTANYLLDISDQLKTLIQEKGISVVRQIVSGSEI